MLPRRAGGCSRACASSPSRALAGFQFSSASRAQRDLAGGPMRSAADDLRSPTATPGLPGRTSSTTTAATSSSSSS
ncbi:MAG: hypothetical protein MZW92_66015 [Comamonadaceae bacterium]|nr:hypothetical protein [Comamonadaceae bacterium]